VLVLEGSTRTRIPGTAFEVEWTAGEIASSGTPSIDSTAGLWGANRM